MASEGLWDNVTVTERPVSLFAKVEEEAKKSVAGIDLPPNSQNICLITM